MQNFEVKAKLADRRRVERQLAALGARRMWVRTQKDTFFRAAAAPPAGEEGGGWLKIREVEGRRAEVISYRRPKLAGEPRVSDYDVITVDDAGAWKRLLGRVFVAGTVVEKERTLWLYENTRVHLDCVVGLGEFVELETVVQQQSLEQARAESVRLMDVLHIDGADLIDGAYADLLPG